MKCFSILIGLMLGSLILNAQKNYAVMITDSKTGNPIQGAAIKIMSTGSVSYSSESGNVVMLISPTDSLFVTAKGYKDRKLNMAGQFIALSIILDQAPAKPKPKEKPKRTRPRN